MSLVILGGGIVDGLVLALVAVGFTVIYNATRVMNFANGQFLMLGAYVVWFTETRWGWPFVVCLLAGVLAGIILGVIADRVFMAPVRQAPFFTQVMILFGLASILDGGFVQVFGGATQDVPPYAPTAGFVPGFGWSWLDLTIMGTTSGVVIALIAFFHFTGRGTVIRAVADNPTGASLVGVNPNSVALTAWGLGGALTALGGVLIIPTVTLDPSVGDSLTFLAFGAVVLGGMGSLTGAIVGGLVIGIAQALVAGFLSAGYEPLVSLVVMLIVLTFRPSGLFGDRT